MYKNKQEMLDFANSLQKLTENKNLSGLKFGIAANFLLLENLVSWKNNLNFQVYAQNYYFKKEGAFTGEISYQFLKDIKVDGSLLGHSERRSLFSENDELINHKLKVGLENNLQIILCVGESLEEYESNLTEKVIANQLASNLKNIDKNILNNLVIAYEPVWAIGTGKTATPEIAENICKFIREWFKNNFDENVAQSLGILYGGSVKPENIAHFMKKENIDGALVGGASLKASDFFNLLNNAQ